MSIRDNPPPGFEVPPTRDADFLRGRVADLADQNLALRLERDQAESLLARTTDRAVQEIAAERARAEQAEREGRLWRGEMDTKIKQADHERDEARIALAGVVGERDGAVARAEQAEKALDGLAQANADAAEEYDRAVRAEAALATLRAAARALLESTDQAPRLFVEFGYGAHLNALRAALGPEPGALEAEPVEESVTVNQGARATGWLPPPPTIRP